MLSTYIPRLGFSTTAAIAQKTYTKFSERYVANLESFKKRVSETANQAEAVKRSTQRAYVHPLHEPHKPVFLGVANALRTDSELRGPEQVSPHYEHFSMARRHALVFMGGLIAYAWTFYYAYNYFWVEGKKYFLMPFLSRFYRKLLGMELANVETYWAENTEARVRNLMTTAKEQIEYKSVHADYLSIRNNSLLSVLYIPPSSSSRSRLLSVTTSTPGPRIL